MICSECRNAADTGNQKGHDKCTKCDCQHKTGQHWVTSTSHG